MCQRRQGQIPSCPLSGDCVGLVEQKTRYRFCVKRLKQRSYSGIPVLCVWSLVKIGEKLRNIFEQNKQVRNSLGGGNTKNKHFLITVSQRKKYLKLRKQNTTQTKTQYVSASLCSCILLWKQNQSGASQCTQRSRQEIDEKEIIFRHPLSFYPHRDLLEVVRFPDNSVYAIVVCSAAPRHKHYCLSSTPLALRNLICGSLGWCGRWSQLFRKIQIIRAKMCCGFFLPPIIHTLASPPPPLPMVNADCFLNTWATIPR